MFEGGKSGEAIAALAVGVPDVSTSFVLGSWTSR
jgi:hypothetical protein